MHEGLTVSVMSVAAAPSLDAPRNRQLEIIRNEQVSGSSPLNGSDKTAHYYVIMNKYWAVLVSSQFL